MPPLTGVPDDFVRLAQQLMVKSNVTKQEFVQLCKLTVDLIEAGTTTLGSRSTMAYYIASFWLGNDNVDDGSITNDIGGQFADWEIPGAFIIDDNSHRPYWEALKSWINIAEEKYGGNAEKISRKTPKSKII